MMPNLFCNWVSPVSSGWKSKVCTSELISPSLHFRARTGGNSNNNHGMWTDNISVRPMIRVYSTLIWGKIINLLKSSQKFFSCLAIASTYICIFIELGTKIHNYSIHSLSLMFSIASTNSRALASLFHSVLHRFGLWPWWQNYFIRDYW